MRGWGWQPSLSIPQPTPATCLPALSLKGSRQWKQPNVSSQNLRILSNDEDEACVFWLALAATQSKLGRLIDLVRDRAIEIIDSGADLRRWENKPEPKSTSGSEILRSSVPSS